MQIDPALYKAGHHSSHNATLKTGGLELTTNPKLVGFIPLDREAAAMVGHQDNKGKPNDAETRTHRRTGLRHPRGGESALLLPRNPLRPRAATFHVSPVDSESPLN